MSDDGPRYYAPTETETVSFGGETGVLVFLGDPVPSYSDAMREHADRLSQRPSFGLQPSYRVLLDLTSVNRDTLDRLLMDDPVLHAVYKLGQQHAYDVVREIRERQSAADMSIDVYAEPAERDHDDEEITE